VQNESAVGKLVIWSFVEAALSGGCDEPFPVKLIIDCIGATLIWM
jgi:hypothetical protein